MKECGRLLTSEKVGGQQLSEEICRRFTVKAHPVSEAERLYLDTFDWRLYNCDLALYREKATLHLVNRKTLKEEVFTGYPAKRKIQFYWDLADTPLRVRVQPILTIRTMLPLIRVVVQTREMTILNRDGKGVVRLSLMEYNFPEHSARPPFISLLITPVRGYAKKAGKFLSFAIGLGLIPSGSGIEALIFKAAALRPGSYSTKISLQLLPEQTISLTTIAVLRDQLNVMRQNTAGIRADLDSEFLHDFRVALRRTRAALNQIKGVFRLETISRYKKELAEISKRSNRLRDLDVYLLQKDYYLTMLPEKLRPGLDHFFKLLRSKRSREKRQVLSWFNSAKYQENIAAWGKFLESYEFGSDKDGPNAAKQTLPVAKKILLKTWLKTITRGRLINRDSPDTDLHDLRLKCKKLRYLLEFFASLFPERRMRFLIKHLKGLQDNLGDFNDVCMQQETLHDYLHREVTACQDFVGAASAIGALLANLNHRQQEIRLRFNIIFKKFDRSKVNKQFNHLFG